MTFRLDRLGGSSPRGRGKRSRWGRFGGGRGLIPARAGKTRRRFSSWSPAPAHPRAGGENQDENVINLSKQGSSPRGRGKLLAHGVSPGVRGLIPARAGKTLFYRWLYPKGGAHPRAGGENIECRAMRIDARGSSPRGRGKRHTRSRRRVRVGLIPARAGKTLPRLGMGTTSRAHPRAGGENKFGSRGRFGSSGSSPRGRGKLTTKVRQIASPRLIPARAGKTVCFDQC